MYMYICMCTCIYIYIYVYTLRCVQVYPTKSALHPQVEEHYNSSMNGTIRLTFAYRPVSWRFLGFHSSGYMKPGNTPLYVHAKSNHPPEILKRIPESINQRLSDISSDEREFNNAAPPYQAALKKSGYEYKLHFAPKDRRNKRRRKRTRNITWFNPPFDARVKTNLGREFLKIVRECFPKRHVLHTIFNRNTLKLSYSCMPNVESIISAHNKNLIKPNTEDPSQNLCNCSKKAECPLDNQCLAKGIREFKNLLRQRRRQRRLKNEFTFYLRIPGHS